MEDEQFIVVVLDRCTAEVDAYGPLPRHRAQRLSAHIRNDLDLMGVSSVGVVVVALRPPSIPL
jgi:hypothetical protein